MALKISPELKSKISKITWKNPEYRKKFEKYYGKIQSPSGIIFEVTGIRRFSREHKLDPSTLINVFRDKIKTHKGWRKYVGK